MKHVERVAAHKTANALADLQEIDQIVKVNVVFEDGEQNFSELVGEFLSEILEDRAEGYPEPQDDDCNCTEESCEKEPGINNVEFQMKTAIAMVNIFRMLGELKKENHMLKQVVAELAYKAI